MSGYRVEDVEQTGIQVVSFPHDDGRRVDLDTVRTFFNHRFFEETTKAKHLVIDLAGVSTLDSSSLSPLVQRFRELQESHGTMVLCGVVSQGLREILSLTRFDRIFDIYDDQSEALKAFTA
jgi:anti-anti-sigma factor